jgi:hypothetical protein
MFINPIMKFFMKVFLTSYQVLQPGFGFLLVFDQLLKLRRDVYLFYVLVLLQIFNALVSQIMESHLLVSDLS